MSFENKKNKIKTLKAFTDVKKIIIANNYEYQYEDIDYTNNLYGPIKVMIDPNDEDTLMRISQNINPMVNLFFEEKGYKKIIYSIKEKYIVKKE